MRMSLSMRAENELNVAGWWTKSPDYVIQSLQSQLESAQAIWPELAEYTLAKRRPGKARGGRAGGNARAAALSPERRSEIASEAAKARWKTA